MAELPGLNYGKRSKKKKVKRSKSLSAHHNIPFIQAKFESSSYGRSLKWRKLDIDNVHQCHNEPYKAWNSASTSFFFYLSI